MRHNKPKAGGKIVVTGSIGGIFPHQTYPEYSGTKAAVNQFVRGVAPMLKAKDNIHINCVLPGIVATPIVPPEMVEAVSPEWYVLDVNCCLSFFSLSKHVFIFIRVVADPTISSRTPMKTVLDAVQIFLEDTTGMAGELLECSADKLISYQLPAMGNGHITKRAVTVWEPLFRLAHGENSDLPDAIPDLSPFNSLALGAQRDAKL
jgi:hypothetical protein